VLYRGCCGGEGITFSFETLTLGKVFALAFHRFAFIRAFVLALGGLALSLCVFSFGGGVRRGREGNEIARVIALGGVFVLALVFASLGL